METEGDFRSIADSAGFLIAHPQGTLTGPGVSIWNIENDTAVADDVGFTEAMIDFIDAEYNINLDRVYATGKSMGGFFSIHLAGQLSEKIAAVASVAGTMTPGMYDIMAPVHPMPLLQIHGTDDFNVPYNGDPLPYLPVTEVLQCWVDFNNCDTTPIVTQLPDIDPNDGSTVERYVYEDGDNGVQVEHLKVIGGRHTWPGSVGGDPGTNYDIDGSEEIWNFLSKYDINGLIEGSFGIETINGDQLSTPVSLSQNYPNPFSSQTTIRFTLEHSGHVILRIYNISGQLVQTLVDEQKAPGEHSLIWNGTDANGRTMSPGMYFCRIDTLGGYDTKSMIKF
jgi:polyhydroxybutyrate depolymerase